MSEVLIVIPARYGSTRLPGKALKLLAGKPVVQHVWEACVKAQVGEVLIATESPIVVDAVARFGAQGVLTSDTCQSGTDRVYEAAQNRPEQIIINVQGDEPFIAPTTVQKIAQLLQKEPACDIASAVAPTLDENKINDPNCVKAVLNTEGKALYFSRSRVPFKRELTEENKNIPYWQHCGIYGYQRKALERFVSLPPSPLEQLERLEQLRALEDGMSLKCVVIDAAGPAIDTAQDLQNAETYYKTH